MNLLAIAMTAAKKLLGLKEADDADAKKRARLDRAAADADKVRDENRKLRDVLKGDP